MLKLIDSNQALEIVQGQTPAGRIEEVSISGAVERTLAETIYADRDYPPFHRARMDGYAVKVRDAGGVVPVRGEVAAGGNPEAPVQAGASIAVMTGAPCPEGTEAVVPFEECVKTTGGIRLPMGVAAGQHITPRGQECEAGRQVAREGGTVTPLALAALASVGRRRVKVKAPPSLAVISTGDEVVEPGEIPASNQIRSSNGPMLVSMAHRLGVDKPVTLLHAKDSLESLAEALSTVSPADIVVFTGGVSAGRYDLVPEAIRRAGAEILFHRVRQHPGRPLLFARRADQLYFGLPGSPISTHFCFHRYVAASIRRTTGQTQPPPRRGRLSRPLEINCDCPRYLPSRVVASDDGWEVDPMVGDIGIFACVEAQAYVWLEPGVHSLPRGAPVTFDPM